jgi:hypothetical protein
LPRHLVSDHTAERIADQLVGTFALDAAQLIHVTASSELERRLDLPTTCQWVLDLKYRLVGVEVVPRGEQLSPPMDPEERTARSLNIDPPRHAWLFSLSVERTSQMPDGRIF